RGDPDPGEHRWPSDRATHVLPLRHRRGQRHEPPDTFGKAAEVARDEPPARLGQERPKEDDKAAVPRLQTAGVEAHVRHVAVRARLIPHLGGVRKPGRERPLPLQMEDQRFALRAIDAKLPCAGDGGGHAHGTVYPRPGSPARGGRRRRAWVVARLLRRPALTLGLVDGLLVEALSALRIDVELLPPGAGGRQLRREAHRRDVDPDPDGPPYDHESSSGRVKVCRAADMVSFGGGVWYWTLVLRG